MIDFLDESGKWKCIQCGACCKMVKDKLPDFALEDGSCKHLVDNKCAIYDTRPDICNSTGKIVSHIAMAMACDFTRSQHAV